MEILDFLRLLWYNKVMENDALNTSTTEEMVTISRAEYEGFLAQKEQIDELEQKLSWLMEQLRLVRHRQFGSSSERISEEGMEQLSLLFNEAEVYADEEKSEPTPVAAHVRHKRSGSVRDIVPEDIKTVVVDHTLPEEERQCPQCGEVMEDIGTEVKETLKIKPAEVYIQRDVYHIYACANCEKNDVSTPVVKTPKDPPLIPGGFASPEAVAHIAVQKFVMGSPLYRQEQELKRRNIFLSRQTMSNWLMWCTDNYLKYIYDELRRELVKHDLLHADETELQVLHEPGKAPQSKSWMWLYRTSGDAQRPIVLYEYRPGWGQEYPKKFLERFRGYLQTDGYAGYNGLENVRHVGCWAHARRGFDEAAKAVPKGKRSPTAEQGLAYCTKLFKLEEEFASLTPKERKERRQKQSKPVLDAMLAWANTRTAAPKSELGKALTYLKNQWQTLTVFLEDGRIELSNNRAERSIKPFVISRKNFLFANTPSGAQTSAVLFSLIETAKENGLDPYKYLTWALTEASRKPAAELVPWKYIYDYKIVVHP